MSRQEQLLKDLHTRDEVAFKELLYNCGPYLVDYCVKRLANRERSVELVLHLCIKWTVDGFADATCPIAKWMLSHVDDECDRMLAALN